MNNRIEEYSKNKIGVLYFKYNVTPWHDLGVKSDIVKLRGPKDDVDLCSKTMNKMYKDLLESNYQVCYIFNENFRDSPLHLPIYHQVNILIYFAAEVAHL